jgi:hypothetical protein
MLAYVAVTLQITLSKLLLSILLTEYETPLGEDWVTSGSGDVGYYL